MTETGTEAAVVTAIIGGTVSARPQPAEFNCNRPFLYAIRDRETGAVLFAGRVVDPSKE